jgi:Zn ribbon nucleic-acid-binding protein
MPSQKLTPCPVCKTAEFISVFTVDDDVPRLRYDVECNKCGTRAYYAGGSEEEAIAEWNRSMERANRRAWEKAK